MLSIAPTLTIDGTDGYVNYKQGDSVTITYTAVDPDSPATVDFFINTNYAVDDNAIPIATGISKDAPGQVTVDTSSLQPGLYYVYGCITDSDGTSEPNYTSWPSVMVLAPADNAPTSHVMLNTSMGSILLDLDRQDTPISVANFLTYVNSDFFNNLIFDRVSTTDHVIQSGGFDDQMNQMPTNIGIPNENSTLGAESLQNLRGTIGMYLADSTDAATSRFYINTADNPSLDYVSADEPGYCVFGHVVSGMDVVDAISAVPTEASGDTASEVPVTPIYIQSVIADRADMQVFIGDTQLLSDSLSAVAWSGTGDDMTFTITNDGALPMTLGNVTLAYNSGFVVTQQPAASVAAGGSTTFTISKAAGVYATRSADVSFTSDAAEGGTFSFSLGRVPSFRAGPDVSVAKDSGPQFLDYWASNILWGTDDSNSTLSFETTNDNEAMFAEQPEVTPDGTLTFTPADGASGTAQVTVILDEVGEDWTIQSQPRTFTITLNAVNVAPSFTAGDDQTASEGDGPQSVPDWATDISAGPSESGQTLTFLVTNDNNGLFSEQPAVSADGTLTYTSAPGARGVAHVTVTLMDDGGTANGGADTSAPQTFTITINAASGTPTADPQNVAMTDSGVVDGVLTGQDAETPDQLTYVLVTGPQHGTVTLTGDGFHYDIDASYNGSDSFTFAVVDAGDGVNPGLMSDPATVTITGGRSVSFDARGHATFVDSAGKNGTATLKRGTGSLFINTDGTIGRVFLSGTTDKSTLTISATRKARVAVLGIDAQGPLASITGKYADLQGDVKLGAATSIKTAAKLTFGTIGDALIDSAMPVKSITAASWLDSDEDIDLLAPSVGSVSIKGDLQIDAWVEGAVGKIKAANLTQSGLDIGGTLGSLTVAGWVDSSTVSAGGNVSSVKVGASRDSDYGSGVSYVLLRDQHHVQAGDADNVPTGTIKTFTVKGIRGPVADFFVNSTISAAMGTVTVTNWDGVEGLYAPAGKVKKVTLKNTFKPAHVFGQFTHPV